MGNEMKYDPVTGQPISEVVEVGEIDQQLKEQYEQQFSTQPVQPQPQVYQQTGQPQVYQQPVQSQQGYEQMVTPQSQQPQTYVQPLNQRQQGYYQGQNMYGQQQTYVAPQMLPKDPDETDPKAKKLLLSTIVCFAAAHLIPRFASIFLQIDDAYGSSISGGIGAVAALVYLAAVIQMIILRVKYPQNKGGKIMMIIMIAEIVVSIIFVALLFASCVMILESCEGMGFLF